MLKKKKAEPTASDLEALFFIEFFFFFLTAANLV